MVLVHSRKRNVILMVCIRSEVPFSKDAKSCCSIGIVAQAVSAFAELSSHSAGAGWVNCQQL